MADFGVNIKGEEIQNPTVVFGIPRVIDCIAGISAVDGALLTSMLVDADNCLDIS